MIKKRSSLPWILALPLMICMKISLAFSMPQYSIKQVLEKDHKTLDSLKHALHQAKLSHLTPVLTPHIPPKIPLVEKDLTKFLQNHQDINGTRFSIPSYQGMPQQFPPAMLLSIANPTLKITAFNEEGILQDILTGFRHNKSQASIQVVTKNNHNPFTHDPKSQTNLEILYHLVSSEGHRQVDTQLAEAWVGDEINRVVFIISPYQYKISDDPTKGSMFDGALAVLSLQEQLRQAELNIQSEEVVGFSIGTMSSVWLGLPKIYTTLLSSELFPHLPKPSPYKRVMGVYPTLAWIPAPGDMIPDKTQIQLLSAPKDGWFEQEYLKDLTKYAASYNIPMTVESSLEGGHDSIDTKFAPHISNAFLQKVPNFSKLASQSCLTMEQLKTSVDLKLGLSEKEAQLYENIRAKIESYLTIFSTQEQDFLEKNKTEEDKFKPFFEALYPQVVTEDDDKNFFPSQEKTHPHKKTKEAKKIFNELLSLIEKPLHYKAGVKRADLYEKLKKFIFQAFIHHKHTEDGVFESLISQNQDIKFARVVGQDGLNTDRCPALTMDGWFEQIAKAPLGVTKETHSKDFETVVDFMRGQKSLAPDQEPKKEL